MKKTIFGLYFFLLACLAVSNTGCYAHVNGAGVGVSVEPHDTRWHYDHDYDDNWRAQHPWRGDHWDN